jgi:hypothetical protein
MVIGAAPERLQVPAGALTCADPAPIPPNPITTGGWNGRNRWLVASRKATRIVISRM